MIVREEYTCPLELTHDIIRGKWKPIILWLLGKEPLSLSQLEHSIKKVTQKMLIEQLKELMSFDIISKQAFDGYPLKVEYSLTDRGHELLQAIIIMQRVGIELMQENGMEEVLKANGFLD